MVMLVKSEQAMDKLQRLEDRNKECKEHRMRISKKKTKSVIIATKK